MTLKIVVLAPIPRARTAIVTRVTARLRVPPVIALLLTGVLIGPSGFGWIADTHEVEIFAEIGVVLLLFVIGLELSLERLRELRRAFFVGGTVQDSLTPSDDWSDLESIEITLSGQSTEGSSPIERTVTTRFFPRNILSL